MPQPKFIAYRNNFTRNIIFLDFNKVHTVVNRRHTALCVTVQVHNSELVFFLYGFYVKLQLITKKTHALSRYLEITLSNKLQMDIYIYISYCENTQQSTFFP
jgi:hypothetical protein